MLTQRLFAASIMALAALAGCGGGGGGDSGTPTAGGSDSPTGGSGTGGGSVSNVLSVHVEGKGTVTSTATGSCTTDCTSNVAASTLVTLTAVPAAGYQFAGWIGGCADAGASCTLTMDAAKSVTAAFLAEPAKSACATDFYSSTFALLSSLAVDLIPSLAKPVKGVAFAEPSYKTCMVRSTDHAVDGVAGFTRNDYSRRQAFNADSSKYMVYALNGSWHVYDAVTRARVKQLSGPAGDAEPQWTETNPDKLYYLPTNGVGMKVNELTVSTNTNKVIGDLAARIKAKWPTANAAWTKSEGSPSKDGRYWCLMVDDASWKSLGVITWDRDTDTILGSMNTNGERPDHVSMSPSGNYCVVSGDGASGTVAYSRDFSSKRQLLQKSEHSDLAIDANGDDVYVSVDYQSAAGDVFMLNLRTGVRTTLFSTYVAGSATALHVSGKGFNKPGWVLLSTYGDYGGKQWLHKKIFAVQLQASPKILNLGFTRAVENGYWTEPHATVNRDFTKVLFNSNWGVNTDTDVDAYMIEFPAAAVK